MSDPGMAGGAAPAPPAPGGGTGELATYGQRLIAYLIDWVILIVIGVICGVLGAILAQIAQPLVLISTLLNLVLQLGYFVVLWGMDNPITERGQTVGKKVMNIKIVKEDGSDLEIKDAVLRLVGYFVSSIVIMLGFVWIFIDENNQGWHDKIAKTKVVAS